jgi:hypothetical protein
MILAQAMIIAMNKNNNRIIFWNLANPDGAYSRPRRGTEKVPHQRNCPKAIARRFPFPHLADQTRLILHRQIWRVSGSRNVSDFLTLDIAIDFAARLS